MTHPTTLMGLFLGVATDAKQADELVAATDIAPLAVKEPAPETASIDTYPPTTATQTPNASTRSPRNGEGLSRHSTRSHRVAEGTRLTYVLTPDARSSRCRN